MARYTDHDGIERQCPHSEYGDRVPTHEDVTAMVMVLRELPFNHKDDAEANQDHLTCAMLVSKMLASYCRQFRHVAGPSTED